MATTKIWAIKDSLSRVLQYASNPDKTFTKLYAKFCCFLTKSYSYFLWY